MNTLKSVKIVMLLSGVLLLSSCLETEDSVSEIEKESDRIVSEYIESNNIQATKSNLNYYYEPIVENPNGVEINTGDVVGIYYKISQLNGEHIDSMTASMGRAIPFVHVANNRNRTIPSTLNLGVTWMKEGETYRFYVPSYLAYGQYSNDTLMPRHANIKIDLTIAYVTDSFGIAKLEEEMMDEHLQNNGISNFQNLDQGVIYYQTGAGTGSAPSRGAFIDLVYKGYLLQSGRVFDQSSSGGSQFQYGVANLINGFQIALDEMVRGEKGVALIPSFAAYGSNIQLIAPPQILEAGYRTYIPPLSPLVFEMEMLDN